MPGTGAVLFFALHAKHRVHRAQFANANKENLTLEVLEFLGVFSEYHGFVLIVDILPFENFIDLIQCVFHRDFARKTDANVRCNTVRRELLT